MTGMQLDLEAIVREVLRRLEREFSADKPGAPTEADAPAPAGTASRPAAQKVGSLHIQDRVVTLARLKDRLSGIRRLVVASGAVITPSVRDELRKRKIQLQVASQPSCPGNHRDMNLLVAAVSGSYDVETVLKTIDEEAGGIERIGASGLLESVEQLHDRVGRDDLPAVLLTTEPVAAVCLANRRERLRAVWAADGAAVQQGCRSIGANLLVLDPTAHNGHELRSLIRQFLQGAHQCPPRWRAALADPRKT